jgi:glucose/mannose transport system permease protein
MWIRRLLPHLVIWPPWSVSVFYIVSFTLWTTWLSFTDSELVTSNTWVGLKNYTSIISTTKV